jgi:replicative DNA helicase
MKVEKQRQGAVGTVPVLFDANKMRYVGIERTK